MTRQEREARQRVRHAAFVRARAYGDAQWTNGYRVAGKDSDDVYAKEQEQWRVVGDAEREFEKALTRYAKAVRTAAREEQTRGQ